MSYTIQATRHGQIVSERHAETTAGARRSLLAMLDRELRKWGGADDVSWLTAERCAENWTPPPGKVHTVEFAYSVQAWNKTAPMRFAITLD